jgi:uncharacterized protein YebE (UPF0316 family)
MTLDTLAPWIITLLIFTARLMDVSIGTIRIIAVGRGARLLAPVLGFFEILIWLMAIRQIFANLNSIDAYLAYAGGFAAGTWVGMLLDDKLAMGLLNVQVITRRDATDLVQALNEQDLGVTSVSARGASGRVRLVFSIVKRKHLPRLIQTVEKLHPRAFVTVSDVRSVAAGVFPTSGGSLLGAMSRNLGRVRKSK